VGTENGFLYKSEQNWSNTLYFEQVGQKKRELRIDIKLSNIDLITIHIWTHSIFFR
jgi:hypothetical protein